MDIAKALGVVLGVLGGTVTIGDRLWASKTEVAKIETRVEVVHEKVDYMYKAFVEAAKYAPENKGHGK